MRRLLLNILGVMTLAGLAYGAIIGMGIAQKKKSASLMASAQEVRKVYEKAVNLNYFLENISRYQFEHTRRLRALSNTVNKHSTELQQVRELLKNYDDLKAQSATLVSHLLDVQTALKKLLRQKQAEDKKLRLLFRDINKAVQYLPEAKKQTIISGMNGLDNTAPKHYQLWYSKFSLWKEMPGLPEEFYEAVESAIMTIREAREQEPRLRIKIRALRKSIEGLTHKASSFRANVERIYETTKNKSEAVHMQEQQDLLTLVSIISLILVLLVIGLMAWRHYQLTHLRNHLKNLFRPEEHHTEIKTLKHMGFVGELSRILSEHRRKVSRFAEMQQGLHDAIEDSQRQREMQNDIVQKIGHEIKDPMTTIIENAQAIVKRSQNDQTDWSQLRNDVRNIANTGSAILTIVDNMLELTEDLGKAEKQLRTFKVRDELQSDLSLFEPLILQNQNRFSIYCPDGSLEVTSDDKRVIKILTNAVAHVASVNERAQVTLKILRGYIADLPAVKFVVDDDGASHGHADNALLQKGLAEDYTATDSYSAPLLRASVIKKYTQELFGQAFIDDDFTDSTVLVVLIPLDYKAALQRNEQMHLKPLSDAL